VTTSGGALAVPLDIDGGQFFTAQEVVADAGVTRQTLWRWRRAGKIPAGHRFRNGQILYSEDELRQIREYANRLEPLVSADDRQLSIFD